MKRLVFVLGLTMLLALPSVSALAGHAIVGGNRTIQCDCTPKDGSYVCLDDATNEPLPVCDSFAAAVAARGHKAK